jgi:tRNA pseudouridine55 synthase
MTAVNGIVVVDKPAGMTSHDVVYVARKLFQTKRVGHTGTLDPDATGVLVLCLGPATRLAEYLSAARKHYVAEVTFGVETDTQDASGQVLAERDASHLTEATVRSLLSRFRGRIMQVPPMMSALHHEGQRLYELARAGVTVERAAREVEIASLELTAWAPGETPTAALEITCSTGTYIRTLAADLGAAGGVGGMMLSLRRTWVGASEDRAFTLREAHTLDTLRARAQAGTLDEAVLPPAAALADWPQARLTESEAARIGQGRALEVSSIDADRRLNWPPVGSELEDRMAALLDESGGLQPVKVFVA